MSEQKYSTLAEALAAFQRDLPSVVKSEKAEIATKGGAKFSYSYADLAKVSAAVLPALGRVGLSFNARPTLDEGGKFVLAYQLRHEAGGELLAGAYPLPSVNSTPQELGSAITYARRYCLCSVTGVAPDEDDDGAAASARKTESSAPAWDPIEQQVLFDGWLAEIEDAPDQPTLTDIGMRMKAARHSGEISPATMAKLSVAGAKRRAEINGAQPAGAK